MLGIPSRDIAKSRLTSADDRGIRNPSAKEERRPRASSFEARDQQWKASFLDHRMMVEITQRESRAILNDTVGERQPMATGKRDSSFVSRANPIL